MKVTAGSPGVTEVSGSEGLSVLAQSWPCLASGHYCSSGTTVWFPEEKPNSALRN